MFETIKLGQIISISKGKKHAIQVEKSEISTRYIQIDDLRNNFNLKYTDDKKGVLVSPNDVVIAWDGANAGTVGYNLTGYIGSTLAVLRNKNPAEYNPQYLALFLQSKFNFLRDRATGATIPHLHRKTLENLKIPKLNINEQIKIANLLTQVEVLITKREESIELLDELLRSSFLDMFGDPITNPQKREPLVRLDDIVVLQRGFDLSKKNRNSEGEVPLFGSNGIVDFHDESKIEKGIITGRSGTIGKVYYSNQPFFPLNTTLFSKDTKDNNIIFLAFLLRFFRLERFSQGAGVPTLNRNIVHKEKIYKIDKKEQDKFATIVQQVEESKEKYQKSLDELRDLFGALSQRAFKGELDLSNMKLEKSKLSININGKKIELDAKKSSKDRLNAGVMPSFTIESMREYEKLSNPMNLGVSFIEDKYKTLRTSMERISKNLIDSVYGLDNYKNRLTSDYFNKWQEQEQDRIKKLIEQSSLASLSPENVLIGRNDRLEIVTQSNSINNWKKEYEKFHQLAGLGKYNENILNFTKEYESLFNPSVTAFDSYSIDRSKYLNEFKLSTMENLGLEALKQSLEVNQPYKIALEQVEAMNSLRGWGESYETLIDRHREKVEETTEVIKSISNLSNLMYDELFANVMRDDSYDDIKALVYKLLDEGKIEQVFDKDKKKLVLTKVEQ